VADPVPGVAEVPRAALGPDRGKNLAAACLAFDEVLDSRPSAAFIQPDCFRVLAAL
jgi:hypothetical protein